MTTAMIFGLGVLVTLIVGVAVVLIGLGEAADPDMSRRGDLTEWELALVEKERARRSAAADETRGSVDS